MNNKGKLKIISAICVCLFIIYILPYVVKDPNGVNSGVSHKTTLSNNVSSSMKKVNETANDEIAAETEGADAKEVLDTTLAGSTEKSTFVDDSVHDCWKGVDFYRTTTSDLILRYYQWNLKDKYKLVNLDFKGFKKKTLQAYQIKELKIRVPEGSTFEKGYLADENNFLYVSCETSTGKYTIYAYNMDTEKSKLLAGDIGSDVIVKVLDNGDIAVCHGNKISFLKESSFEIIEEIENTKGVVSISNKGDKLAYITENGLFVSDLHFNNPKYLFPSKFCYGKLKSSYYMNSVSWTGGDKKIVYSIGEFAEEPLGIGIMNPDGTENINLFTRSTNYECFSDGNTVLHNNYVIDFSKKEFIVLPATPLYQDENKHLHVDSDSYSNCGPTMKRFVHTKRGTDPSDAKQDEWHISDLNKNIEYKIPNANKDYVTFVSWAPSSKSFIYTLRNDNDLRFIQARLPQ